jgi:hypothetical protein
MAAAINRPIPSKRLGDGSRKVRRRRLPEAGARRRRNRAGAVCRPFVGGEAFSSQVETLGGSENATKQTMPFSSQVETLGGSENATKHA